MMQHLEEDLINGFEVLSLDGDTCRSPLKKKTKYTKVDGDQIREFIYPSIKEFKQDERLEKTVTSADAVGAFVKSSLIKLGFSHLNVHEHLSKTADMMMKRFHLNTLKCRMDYIHSDKCRKFHIDRVYVRSITTLLGPGTELRFSNDPENIYQVETANTVLLKGSLYPEYDLSVQHKSPKISHLEQSRLIFVMDY